jgi:bile acid-coenzyme A ligase
LPRIDIRNTVPEVAISYGRRIEELARQDPGAPAVLCEGAQISRGELERRANRLARAYAARGVGPGRIVTLALPNGIELVVACIATWKLGAVPSPISPALPRPERDAILERAGPALVVGVPPGEAGGRAALPAGFEPDAALSDAPLPDATSPHERALASGGSTGRPKLIVPAQPASYDPAAPSRIFHARRAVLVPGPLSHAVPFSATFQGLFCGARVVLMARFDARRCLELIERHRVDRVHFVPTMMLRIWRLPEAERLSRDVSSLEFVMTGGAPCPAWLMRAWIDWLGPDVMHEAFGPSERIGGTFITGREWLEHPGSVGRPSPGSRLRILDPETGEECPPGTLGEIYGLPAGGPGSTYHYVGAEARRTPDGWESVGDMGWLDESGYLYLGDRRSDMILVGGRNVYPAEIEAALEEHPAVRSSCAIGLPDEDLGQRIHALVELAWEVSDAELLAHLRERLAAYKLPRSFERSERPLRDEAGKVRRSALRAARSARAPARGPLGA